MLEKTDERKSYFWVACLTIMLLIILLNHHQWSSLDKNKPPQAFNTLPNFSLISSTAIKKEAFFNFLRPFIRQENQQIKFDRAYLMALNKDIKQSSHHYSASLRKLKRLAKKYHFEINGVKETLKELKLRIDVLPESLVLVQAANESAWGTSRFAREANNLFGQWCYVSGCGVIPKKRNQSAKHEVKKFSSPQASIKSYMRNLNTHIAYKELRQLRFQLKQSGVKVSGTRLAQGLINYSEKKETYIKELIHMIKQNKLE